MNQTVLAELTETSRPSISNTERGSQLPSTPVLLRMAKALNCDLNWLLGVSQEVPPPHAAGTIRDLYLVIWFDGQPRTTTVLYQHDAIALAAGMEAVRVPVEGVYRVPAFELPWRALAAGAGEAVDDSSTEMVD